MTDSRTRTRLYFVEAETAAVAVILVNQDDAEVESEYDIMNTVGTEILSVEEVPA